MSEEKKYTLWETQMAFSVLLGFIMCPILTQAFLIDEVGAKGLIFLVFIIPYYCGLWKFKKTIFGINK